jgi:hypothetical protein
VAARTVDREAGEQLGGVAAGVDDAECLRVRGEAGGEFGVGERRAAEVGDTNAAEDRE